MKKSIIVLLLPVLFLFSCVSSRDVSIIGVKNYELNLPSTLKVTVGVDNRSGHKLGLLSFRMSLKYHGEKAYDILLSEPAIVLPHYTGDVPMAFRFHLTDPIQAFAAAGSLTAGIFDDFTVDGEMVLRAGWQKKKIKFDNEPLTSIIHKYGLDLKAI